MGEKPTAAFVLSLIGAIFIILGGLAVISMGAWLSFVWVGDIVTVVGILGLIFGIIAMVGAIMINSGERGRVRRGSILVLVFSILSLISLGGFILGFILCLVGSILGLTWKPPAEAPSPPP